MTIQTILDIRKIFKNSYGHYATTNIIETKVIIRNVFSYTRRPYEILIHKNLDVDKTLNFIRLLTGKDVMAHNSAFVNMLRVSLPFNESEVNSFKNFMLNEVREDEIAIRSSENLFE